MQYPFFNTQQGGIQNSHWNSRLIRHGDRLNSWKNGCQNCSNVHSTFVAAKHWQRKHCDSKVPQMM